MCFIEAVDGKCGNTECGMSGGLKRIEGSPKDETLELGRGGKLKIKAGDRAIVVCGWCGTKQDMP